MTKDGLRSGLRSRRRAALALIVALGGALALAPSVGATGVSVTASEELTEGGFEFIGSTPAALTFPATKITGKNIVITKGQPFNVSDARGTGAGWNITATSTLFKNGTHALSSTATTIGSAPADECDAEATCTKATNAISYPYTLPAGETLPTATKMFDAAENSGMGNQTVTPTWSLTVPGNAYKGIYTATWEFSLVSGP
jgi:hypothetical protein